MTPDFENTPRTRLCIWWLNDFLFKHADYHPVSGKRWLAKFYSRGYIYELYLEDLKQTQSPPISVKHFHRVWKDNFSQDVSIYKHSPFTKCSVCVHSKDILNKKPTEYTRKKVTRERQEHMDHCT